MTTEHTVAAADDGIRLDRWFKRHYPGFPHALLEKNLRKGLIRLDGRKAKTSDRVVAGQVVRCPEITLEDRPKTKPAVSEDDARAIRDWVLYKDANIIIINKPFGLPVQGGSKITKSVDDMLGALAEDGERPKLVHRLDRDTSGVLVLARSARVAGQLSRGFSGKSIEKTYWAIVNGCPLQLRGSIELSISKQPGSDTNREQMVIDEEEGKYALTEYRVIDQLARKFALMELRPMTGRTHQLRVHMQAIGCPIVGDHKYGGSMNDAKALGVENILHLHARRIVLPPVAGGKKVDVSAPLPPHMVKSFKALGLDVPKK